MMKIGSVGLLKWLEMKVEDDLPEEEKVFPSFLRVESVMWRIKKEEEKILYPPG